MTRIYSLRLTGILSVAAAFVAGVALADAPRSRVDFTGVWEMPARHGPEAYPEIRVPAPERPRLTPKYRAIYEASEKARMEAEARGEPLVNDRTLCFPDGMPKMMATTFPMEILHTAKKLVIIAEFNTQVRHVYFDGTHPSADELEYNFFGSSVGQWQGDTLVVDTVGLGDSTVMFQDVPHSDQLRIEERFRLRNPDVLEVTITMTDPVVLERPWTVVREFSRRDDLRLREFVCTENNRHGGDEKGVIATKPTGESQ